MAAFGKESQAPCKWAQRTDTLYLTISLPDVKEEVINVTEKNLTFSGKSNGTLYKISFDFFKPIDLEGSVWNVLPSSVQMKLNKKDKDEEYWARLTTDKIKEKNTITIDWDRYKDEDEQDDAGFDESGLAGGQGMGGPGGMMGGMPGGMGGMGGMSGMGGMDMEALMKQFGGGLGGGGGGGMPDFGSMGDDQGDDQGDSDDENDDLPDLEPTNP